MTATKAGLVILVAVGLGGCVTQDQTSDELVQRVIISRSADGSLDSRTVMLTRSEQAQNLAFEFERDGMLDLATVMKNRVATYRSIEDTTTIGVAAQADLTKDTSCGSGSVHLFDAANLGGREICFNPTYFDSTNLHEWIRYISGSYPNLVVHYWDAAVQSWANPSVYDANLLQNSTTCVTLVHGTYSNSVSGCTPSANVLAIPGP